MWRCDAAHRHAVAQQTAFRVRADADAGLNADAGWAGAVGENVAVHVEQPFRLRVEVEHILPVDTSRRFRLQVQHNGGAWTNVPAADFPYPSEATPRVSIVSTDAYADGAATADVLDGSRVPFRVGAGVSLADAARPLPADTAVHSEWAWPLVIRRFADGAVTTDEGDTFSFRMTDAEGRPVASDAYPTVTASVPPRLLGGTFVETPGRIGPWEAANGDLYFLMEPAETYNVLMVVKSTDGGTTWHEVDGANRPATGDLEGFASDQHGNTIHMLHQTDEAVLHQAFRTSGHATAPDTWVVRDDTVATPGEPPVQVATLNARSDGSRVGVRRPGENPRRHPFARRNVGRRSHHRRRLPFEPVWPPDGARRARRRAPGLHEPRRRGLAPPDPAGWHADAARADRVEPRHDGGRCGLGPAARLFACHEHGGGDLPPNGRYAVGPSHRRP
ncbi:MAG: hypothetical protein GVY35_04940 [Bacteroidetes bacterium]|nr:hypothetical protein [Bacteroidota bacterium]